MTPVKIVAADDESGVLLLLHSILIELDGIQLIGTAKNALDTLGLVKEQKPHLVLLDIELPDMKGIELAEKLLKIKPDLYIVFITAHKEYSLDAFRLYAYDYILKPIHKERVKTTVRRIQQAIRAPEKILANLTSHLQTSRISVTLGNERVFVNPGEIYYLEKNGRHTLVHCINEKFKSRETLHDFEQRLGTAFFRSHKAYIINIKQVDRIVNLPGSSYYEVKFKNCKGKALLSRERVHTLMRLLES